MEHRRRYFPRLDPMQPESNQRRVQVKVQRSRCTALLMRGDFSQGFEVQYSDGVVLGANYL